MNNLSAQVQMLGGFRLTIGDISITNKVQQAKKPWTILEYLVYYHSREIPSDELVGIIWPEDNNVNPANALKTLIFRTRKLLEPFKLSTQQLITQNHGTYCWNPEVSLSLDTSEFESLYKQSCQPGLPESQQLEFLLKALALYKGDFLPKAAWEPWVIPISRHYHSIFVRAVMQAVELLLKDEQWDSIIRLCRHAVSVEALNEDFQYYYIYALFSSGRQRQALEQYRVMVDSFYNEFAITPSERMANLYKLIQDREHGVNTDLSLIQKSMQESQQSLGAYFCEFTVFRDIYQLERRAIARTGDSIFLGLLTLSQEDGSLPKASVLTRAMGHLGNAATGSLRHGDVYTRYSVSQYMILLPSASYENGEMVMQRIIRNYKKAYLRKDIIVHYSLQAVAPIEN
ncbi:MAG: SARP family transcriptional regulator [Lachnospiraceae bacterium]|nr:SARP family transcriptional regulator [Lachnospiraceae bacterium]